MWRLFIFNNIIMDKKEIVIKYLTDNGIAVNKINDLSENHCYSFELYFNPELKDRIKLDLIDLKIRCSIITPIYIFNGDNKTLNDDDNIQILYLYI